MIEASKKEQIQNEAFSISIRHHRCGIAGSVGIGKTRIGLRHMRYLLSTKMMTRFLVVGPKKAVYKSWQDEIEKVGFNELLPLIEFTTYRSLSKKNPKNYDCVYLDECHNLLESHLPFLSVYTGMVLGLTGTPPRYQKSLKARMVSTYCPIQYTYLTDDAVEDEILNDYHIIVHEVELSNTKDLLIKTKQVEFMTSEVQNYEFHNNRISMAQGKSLMFARLMRMKAMMEYRSKEQYAKNLLEMIDNKCIIFCNTTEQADRLCDVNYHSKNPDEKNEYNLDAFKSGKEDTLSCVLQLSEGINIPNLRTAIILHAYGNEKKFMQRFGRMMRLAVGEKATIHLLMFKGTQDEKWVSDALQDLDPSKITYYR